MFDFDPYQATANSNSVLVAIYLPINDRNIYFDHSIWISGCFRYITQDELYSHQSMNNGDILHLNSLFSRPCSYDNYMCMRNILFTNMCIPLNQSTSSANIYQAVHLDAVIFRVNRLINSKHSYIMIMLGDVQGIQKCSAKSQ